MGELRALAQIAERAGDDEVLGTVKPAANQGNDVIDVVGIAQRSPAPIFASSIASGVGEVTFPVSAVEGGLPCDSLPSVRSSVGHITNPCFFAMRFAVCRTARVALFAVRGVVDTLPTPDLFAVRAAVGGSMLELLVAIRRIVAARPDDLLLTMCCVIGVLARPDLFWVRLPIGGRACSLASTAFGLEPARTVLAETEELGRRQKVAPALGTRLVHDLALSPTRTISSSSGLSKNHGGTSSDSTSS